MKCAYCGEPVDEKEFRTRQTELYKRHPNVIITMVAMCAKCIDRKSQQVNIKVK